MQQLCGFCVCCGGDAGSRLDVGILVEASKYKDKCEGSCCWSAWKLIIEDNIVIVVSELPSHGKVGFRAFKAKTHDQLRAERQFLLDWMFYLSQTSVPLLGSHFSKNKHKKTV